MILKKNSISSLRNNSMTYIFYQDSKISKTSSVEYSYSCISSQDYLDLITFETIESYKSLNFNSNCSKLPISKIWDQIDAIQQNININNFKNNKIAHLKTKISIIKKKLLYILKSDKQMNINSDPNIIQISEKIQNFEPIKNDTNFITSNLTEITEYVKYFNKAFNKIVNFLKVFRLNHFKIFLIINNVTVLLEEYFRNIENSEIQNISLKSCIIDQNQEPILVMNQNFGNETNKRKEIIKIYADILIKYQERIKNEMNGEMNNFFKREISIFLNQINKMIILTFIKKQTLLNLMYPKLKLNENSADEYWRNIIYYFMKEEKSKIITNFSSIFKFYSDYIDEAFKTKILNEFMKIYNKKNSNLNGKTIEQIIEEIMSSDKCFYIDFLFQIIIKNLSNMHSSTNNDEKKYISIRNISYLTSKLCYDEKYNFFLEISDQTKNKELEIIRKTDSKFIIQMKEKVEEDKIIIPYYPLGTYNYLILKNQHNIYFTNVDKIVMIIEIASALSYLHSNNEFYGNLSSNSIFINSHKDAYLIPFYNKSKKSIYYHSPEIIKGEKKENIQLYGDIYSFGVLMHAILTEESPESRMKYKTESEINQILTKNYSNFIFSGKSNECFDNNFTDIRGDSLIGMKEIIDKCIKQDIEERYDNIEDIIEEIQQLVIYERNKEEIETRISSAASSTKYECHISDLVESYLRGHQENINDIEKTILSYHQLPLETNSSFVKGDVITIICEAFNIKINEDLSFILDDFISVKEEENPNQNYGIFRDNYIDFMTPIFSLSYALYAKDSLPFNYVKLLPIWAFSVSKELANIHENNQYLGHLTKETIKIYYNKETNTYISSFLLCNSYSPNNATQTQNIETLKKEDIDSFLNVFKKIMNFPQNLFNSIEYLQSMKLISDNIFQFIINDSDDETKTIFEKNYLNSFYFGTNKKSFNYFSSFSKIQPQTKPNNKFLENILHISRYHSPQESSTILQIINSFFIFYADNISNIVIKKSLENFLSLLNENKSISKSSPNDSIQKRFEKAIDEIQQRNKYFYFDFLFHILITNILDQNIFDKIITDKDDFGMNELSNSKYKVFESSIVLNDSTAKLCYNNKLHFFTQISFSGNISQNLIDKEIEIYSSNQYSKFVVHMIEKTLNNVIIVPYFPLGTLDTLINDIHVKKVNQERIDFTFVDKIVIILEIANALESLHSNEIYHGNLTNKSIYISSTKNAYLGGFSSDKSQASIESKTGNSLYYLPPEIIFQKYQINDFEDNDQPTNQKENEKTSDIYAFGVLMHELFTETQPKSRIGNQTKSEIMSTVSHLSDFLFSSYNNECFDNNFTDIRGDSLIGMKEIIDKCIKQDIEERYENIEDIIEEIQQLVIYERNKEEIETRISSAASSTKYECHISDLVESYLRGHQENINDIEKTILSYHQLPLQQSTFDLSDKDIIKSIFEEFKIKFNEDFSFVFTDIFNFIIQRIYTVRNVHESQFDILYSLSIETNINEKITSIPNGNQIYTSNSINFIIPIASLGNFIQSNKSKYSDISLLFAFLIAKELLLIHSHDLFHGELSKDTIGVYYSKKTQTFLPSLILFYSFYKIKGIQPSKIKNSFISDEIIEKYQRKDIKNFKKILHEIEGIPETVLNLIDGLNSINIIVFRLYNFIIKDENENRKKVWEKNYDLINSGNIYSSFSLTYPVLNDLFNFIKSNDYSLENIFVDFEVILKALNEFLDIIILNPNSPISHTIPLNYSITKETEKQNEAEIKDLFESIKSKCSMWDKIYHQLVDTEFVDESLITEKDGMHVISSSCQLKKAPNFTIVRRQKYKGWKKVQDQFIERKIEISGLYLRSAQFLMQRYMFNLNPDINYTFIVKINNKMYSEYQDEPFRAEHAIYYARQLGPFTINKKDGNVIITIPAQRLDSQ